MSLSLRLWCRTVLLALPLAALADPSPLPKVDEFTPSGLAKEVRQAKARFSAPMVPFGSPTPEAPFEVDCPAKGQGRWPLDHPRDPS